jgi:parvulin-like peptidyl-prolyl isomerase
MAPYALGIVGVAALLAASAKAGDGILSAFGKKKAPAQDAASGSPPAAMVNGEIITREDLAIELIETYGPQQLDLLINRKLVEQACKAAHIEVTQKEIDEDVKSTLKQLNLSAEEFRKAILTQRGITFHQYVRDNVWPKVAIVKLVKDKVAVSDEDLRKGLEATYGEKVETRMLTVMEMNRAKEIWEKLMAIHDPSRRLEQFESYCKEYSTDAASRPYGGRIAPYNRHSSNPDLENALFKLKDGELSTIMQINGGNAIFLCVRHIAAQPGVTLDSILNETTKETVRHALHESIYTRKLQYEAAVFFDAARKKARIENYITGAFNEESVNIGMKPDAAKTQK